MVIPGASAAAERRVGQSRDRLSANAQECRRFVDANALDPRAAEAFVATDLLAADLVNSNEVGRTVSRPCGSVAAKAAGPFHTFR